MDAEGMGGHRMLSDQKEELHVRQDRAVQEKQREQRDIYKTRVYREGQPCLGWVLSTGKGEMTDNSSMAAAVMSLIRTKRQLWGKLFIRREGEIVFYSKYLANQGSLVVTSY